MSQFLPYLARMLPQISQTIFLILEAQKAIPFFAIGPLRRSLAGSKIFVISQIQDQKDCRNSPAGQEEVECFRPVNCIGQFLFYTNISLGLQKAQREHRRKTRDLTFLYKKCTSHRVKAKRKSGAGFPSLHLLEEKDAGKNIFDREKKR